MENFANNFVTTLAADITSSATTLSVASASGAPSPNFRILVDGELMLVTGVSGTDFTVTRGIEGTGAVAHTAAASGVAINLVRYPMASALATYSAISSYDNSYLPGNAADGGYGANGWAKNGYTSGDWWRCDWTVPQSLSRIKMWGRPTGERFGSGYIEFSDGSTSVTFSNVWDNSNPVTVDFTPKSGITWFRLVSTSGGTGNPGLAEVEAYLIQTPVTHVLTAGGLQAITAPGGSLVSGAAYSTTRPFKMPWSAAVFDPDGYWNSGDATKLTVPTGKGGRLFYAFAIYEASISNAGRANLYVNGTIRIVGPSTGNFTISTSAVLYLADGDFLEMEVAESGSVITSDQTPYMALIPL